MKYKLSIYVSFISILIVGGYLPSAYNYALFNSYGISRSTIELFFVYCFVSSLLAGTLIASFADRL